MPHPGCDTRQYGQVEVDDVPPGQHIRIQLPDPPAEPVERRSLAGAGNGPLRHGPAFGIDYENLVSAASENRDGQQALGLPVGFDVERQHTGRKVHRRGFQVGVVENPTATRTPARFAADQRAAPDVPVDEVAHGEPHIRFQRLDAAPVQPVPQRRCVRRRRHIDAPGRLAREGDAVGGCKTHALPVGRGRLAHGIGTHVEMRRLAAVANEKGLPVLQATEQVHDGHTRLNAVARLVDEAAMAHGVRCRTAPPDSSRRAGPPPVSRPCRRRQTGRDAGGRNPGDACGRPHDGASPYRPPPPPPRWPRP